MVDDRAICASGRVVGRDQHEVQQIVDPQLSVGPEVGVARSAHRERLDQDHFAGEIDLVVEGDERRHDLGDAGDGTCRVGVLFPEHLLGDRVVDDGGGRADVGHHRARLVHAVQRVGQFAHLTRVPCGLEPGGARPARGRVTRALRRARARRLPSGCLLRGHHFGGGGPRLRRGRLRLGRRAFASRLRRGTGTKKCAETTARVTIAVVRIRNR